MTVEGEQEIAIIGSGCRFPGNATSPSKLWDLLREPRLVASQVPALKGFYHENGQYHGHANVKEAYLLTEDGEQQQDQDHHRRFDAAFFGINPAEANVLDPQIRLLLETVYEALEAGGQTVSGLRGSDTAVYAGQMVNDYELVMYRDHENLGKYHATGTSRTMLSNRVSYFFDWRGPSVTLDTACSSSLVALHLAVQQLRLGLSRVAVVAGSNLIFDAGTFIAETNLQMLSPEGRSRMWDAGANGYARGEGVAAVVLKTRRAAEADGDHIECIIRETAVGQDGKTPGQTMPSASAQAQLIRDCYQRAGLDLANPMHRPQYFEAHGTGTPAGDPIEAEAISSTFFPSDGENGPLNPLFVGSIKTVVGHTEGTAGIAGVLKASLAIQNAMIPPNLLFNRLNPDIEPFYGDLRIPTTLMPWPAVAEGSPRRVSVNSFGFGGTNAHAILESYEPPARLSQQHTSPIFMPFVFSAASEASLKSYLGEFCRYLREHETACDMRDIAFTLATRRTRLLVATSIGAPTCRELCEKLEEKLKAAGSSSEQRVGVRMPRQIGDADTPRVLGVFTGQGAQWARMGSELITASAASQRIIQTLQRRLDQLPAADRPKWSLVKELQKDAASSRIADAALSQPLCTAVQILQVELLRAAGIKFTAVVGHSSGEIAAAYAAGLISAGDAICIAYYRGLYSGLARGSGGQKGAMMAVRTSADDAHDLLSFPEFEGRACVAAVNSATSVTLSGDQDAIKELEIIFRDEKKPTRILRVDTAYHSHHMEACSAKYLDAITALDVEVGPGGRSVWFSSVYGTEIDTNDLLKGPYWDRNMVRPVLFMQAIDSACAFMGSVDLTIELGPHPALKSPALQTIQGKTSLKVPYTGLFHRGISAITSFADGLGYAWLHMGKGAIALENYDQFLSGNSNPRLVKGLPKYAWDHSNEYWHESRYARAVRMRPDPVHELLGHLTPDSTAQDMRWRHTLRLSEIQWLLGHRLQNVVIFPATGYVVGVLEAALKLCEHNSARLVEIHDMNIISALIFDPDDVSIEMILSVTDISKPDEETIEANFKYHATSGKGTEPLELKARGRIRIRLGRPHHTILPSRLPQRPNLLPVSEARFYESLSELEYQYSGQFLALKGMKRALGAASGSVAIFESSSSLIHPAALDAAFQSIFLAYASPDDGAQKSMHLPTSIARIAFNPDLCAHTRDKQISWAIDTVSPEAFPHANMVADIDIYPDGLDHAMVQVQGLECRPFSQHTASSDKEVFSNIVWGVLDPDAYIVGCDGSSTPGQSMLVAALERAASYYLRVLDREIPIHHQSRIEEPYNSLFKFISLIEFLWHAGESQFWQSEWERDTPETIAAACEPFADTIDVKIISDFGKNLVDIVKGDESAVDFAMRANLVKEWYTKGFGIKTSTAHLTQILKQMIHRYPRMHILEVGGEIGTATETILQEIGSKFASYTVTTTTSDSFNSVKNELQWLKDKIKFKPFDASKDVQEQDLPKASYDVVIASLALHTTPDLDRTLRNLRRLLKPGGHLLVLEVLPRLRSYLGIIFRGFPNRWADFKERKTISPIVTPMKWDELLRNNGFSGIDSRTEGDNRVAPFYVFISQAVDEKIAFLREPLSLPFPSSTPKTKMIRDMIVLSEESQKRAPIACQLSDILRPYCSSIRNVHSLMDLADADISSDTVVLSLRDLDTSVFKRLDSAKWEALKKAILLPRALIWVTRGRLADKPYANMMLGLIRGAARDNPTLDYLLLDTEDARKMDHRVIAETVLRHIATSQWRQHDNMKLTVENELVLDKTGRFLIPRLVMNEEMNDRYNSNHRDIRRQVKLDHHRICIYASDSKWDVKLKPPAHHQDHGSIQLRTTHSLLSPIRVAEFGCMFMVFGENTASGNKMIALSTENTSLVYPKEEFSIPVTASSGSETQLLWLTAHYLLASVVLRGLSKGDKVLVNNPRYEFASIIAEQAAHLGVQVTFVVTNTNALVQDSSWLRIHPATPKRDIARLISPDFSVFVDMTHLKNVEPVVERIASTFTAYCRREYLESLFGKTAWDATASHTEDIRSRFTKAVAWASIALENPTKFALTYAPSIPINTFPQDQNRLALPIIVEWNTISEVSVEVQPVDSLVSLPGNKTYWLVGLTGGLGLSLCEWMVQRGARYFVISSRKPNVEMTWLDKMRAKGVTIKISACDVTERREVVALYAEICSVMPEVAGVAQGAMVLQDVAIQDMTLEQLSAVAMPKVKGSIHLNEIFHENTLDFFVFFSSTGSVIGNHGQANYAAANTFMASLAERRRRLGLAASIIHIGPIFGVGYIARAAEGSLMGNVTLQTGGFVRTSERDLHQLFAEAIVAGRPGSTAQVELVSGVRRISQQEEHQPVWESWSRMSHFVEGHGESEDPITAGNRANLPIKALLEKACSREQVYTIIWDAFTHKLGSYFQLDTNQLSNAELNLMRFDHMGIDSLTAIEIRGWFMKTLDVNIPVLKIMNGGTIGELVTTATETIPSRLVSRLDGYSAKDVSAPSNKKEITRNLNGDTGKFVAFPQAKKVLNLESIQDSPPTTSSGSIILKSVPVSFTQARFYPSGIFLEDRVGLNHTAWARITGKINPERLAGAVRALGQQHEILRTAFFDQDEKQMQHVLDAPLLHLEHQEIESEEEVERIAMAIQKGYVYDVARGETSRLILLTRSGIDNYLVAGFHPLVIDATSLQTFLKWLAFHYTYPNTNQQVKQFAEASEQRYAAYAAGKFEPELQYWRKEFATTPPPLPLLTLTKVDERPVLKAYENIRAGCRISVDIKQQIFKICRRIQVTPFQFYLAALRALLLRYTIDGEDVIMGVAESGRTYDVEDMDVIGPLYNLVLVRISSHATARFEELLEITREKTLAAMEHSKVPYPMVVKELGLQREAKYYPFFQVFADYRMGQRDTTPWGDNNELQMMGFDLNVPYDVYLDTIDEPDGECAHYFFLRKDLFGEAEAEKLARSYERLICAFAAQPRMAVSEVDLAED
ncbi:uncharacterized protein F4812DRAFT_465308 [Daldinia caldariorum]|uniref:uncharacterized protein n=1 Tax=Daldinia caldariorum TaxID=326644 RepID=UPI002007EC8C|nr:uncharacterized protein F4812DRAFT_465308 [Daldinia caldariorum]KAI1467236.1 hypothetical protein F4812DRAFT_465308 [Daldinia caldariorum]